MLDFSMGEIGLIAAVALVVLGPDKLPQVAKTAGTLMGRAQRFVSQVKNDIDKEVELSELKKIQEDARKMAADLQSNLKNTTDQIEKQVKEVSDSVNNAGQDLKSQVDSATKDIKDSWMDSTSPKAELSMENIVEQKPEEAVKPAEVGDWGDLDRQIDTSSLESAFNWHETGIEQTQAVPQELQGPAPKAEDIQPVAAAQPSEDALAELRRELADLRKQISARASFAPAQRVRRGYSRVESEPRRRTHPRLTPRIHTAGRFAPNSHTNRTRISS